MTPSTWLSSLLPNEKKVYAKYLASKLVEGNWKITEDDSEGTQED